MHPTKIDASDIKFALNLEVLHTSGTSPWANTIPITHFITPNTQMFCGVVQSKTSYRWYITQAIALSGCGTAAELKSCAHD